MTDQNKQYPPGKETLQQRLKVQWAHPELLSARKKQSEQNIEKLMEAHESTIGEQQVRSGKDIHPDIPEQTKKDKKIE